MSGDKGTRDPSQIEADLAHNRAALEATADKLQHKFTPGEIFDQAWRYARARNADGTTSRMKDSVVRNPLPVALIGMGVAWLLLAGRQGSVPSQRSAHGHSATPESASVPTTAPARPASAAQSSVAPTPVAPTPKPTHAQAATPPPAPSARNTPPRSAEPKPKPARPAAAKSTVRPAGPVGRP